jgi:tetratricopeptide (TPR) repeat protein
MNNDSLRQTIEASKALRSEGQLVEAAKMLEGVLGSTSDHDLFDVVTELVECHLRAGSWADAHRQLDAALTRTSGAQLARLRERKAWTFFREGRLDEAQKLAKQLLEANDPTVGAGTLAGLHNTLGGIAWYQGRSQDAIEHVRQAATLYGRAGDRFGAASTETNLGTLLYTLGRWPEAASHFARSEKIRAEVRGVAGRAVNLLSLGLLEMSMGDHGAARRHLEAAVSFAQRAGERFDLNRARIGLAHLDVLHGRLAAAGKHLDEVLATRECLCDDDIVQASWLKALIEFDRGGVEAGMKLAMDARKLAHDQNLLESEADCCRAIAIAHSRTGDYHQAERLLHESLALADRAGDPYRRALALLELGNVCHEAACADQSGQTQWKSHAQTSVDAAARVFGNLGASYDLKRAETLRSTLSV